MSVLRVLNDGLVDLPFSSLYTSDQLAAGSRHEGYIMGTRLD